MNLEDIFELVEGEENMRGQPKMQSDKEYEYMVMDPRL